MATQEKTWNVANRLHSLKDSDNPEVNHIIAGADEIYDDTKGAKQSDINAQTETALADRYTKDETYSKEQLDSLITTPDVSYVSVVATNATTAVTDILPATGEANTIYRVGNWNGTQYDPTMYALFAWNGTTYVCLAVRSFVGEVYDISVNHPDGQGNPTPYADLAAALGTDGANIPADIRRGGMSIKFIQGTVQSSDNKYVQYRYIGTSTTADAFTNVANWGKVVTFTDTYSMVEGAANYIDNIIAAGVYKGSYGMLYVMSSSGIVYQILENVNTNGYNLTFRKKENDTWSSNSIFDDRLHLPVIKANVSLTINKDSIVFSNCYIYFNYSRKPFSSTLSIEGNGVYRIIADHSTTTITCFLLAMSGSDEYLDLAGYTTIGIINVVNGVIEDVLINAIGNVIYNNKINVDNKIEVDDSILLNTGFYIGTNGALTSSVSWKTWLIKAKKGDVITATLGSNATPEYMIAAYDSQKFSQSFIEGTENKATTSSKTNNYKYSVTEDSFVLVSNRTATLNPPIIHHYTSNISKESDADLIICSYPLFSGYLATGTSWSTNPKNAKHIKIPVSFCERYSIKGVGSNINYAFLSDEEGATSIDEIRHIVGDGVTDTVIVPFGASFLYVQLATSAGVNLTENVEIVKLSDYVLPTWQVAQHDLGIMDIEYSVLSGAPGNSIAHFERAVSDGFKYLKADMRITSDGYIVLCHDAGYTFNDDGRIISYNASNSTPINTLTLAEVKALEFASQVAGEYVHPCSLEEFLVLCKKHGVTPYLTVRPEDYILTIPESLRLLKKFALDAVGIYNLYTTKDALWSMCRAFNEENNVLRCYTIHGANDVFDKSQLAIAMEMGCAYIDIWKVQESSLTDSMWEIINKQKMRILSIASTESDFEESVGRGTVGWQNYSRNKFGS